MHRTSLPVIVAVGKSALMTRFIYDKFDHMTDSTISCDVGFKTMYTTDRIIRLQVWDTPGNERFNSLVIPHISHCVGAVVVYSTTRKF